MGYVTSMVSIACLQMSEATGHLQGALYFYIEQVPGFRKIEVM